MESKGFNNIYKHQLMGCINYDRWLSSLLTIAKFQNGSDNQTGQIQNRHNKREYIHKTIISIDAKQKAEDFYLYLLHRTLPLSLYHFQETVFHFLSFSHHQAYQYIKQICKYMEYIFFLLQIIIKHTVVSTRGNEVHLDNHVDHGQPRIHAQHIFHLYYVLLHIQ